MTNGNGKPIPICRRRKDVASKPEFRGTVTGTTQ